MGSPGTSPEPYARNAIKARQPKDSVAGVPSDII